MPRPRHLVIEKDIPFVTAQPPGTPWQQMEIGDSVSYPNASLARDCVKRVNERHAPRVFRWGYDAQQTARVWREA